MKTFNPSKRVAPTAPVAQSTNNSTVSLVGLTASQVSEACQWKITAGRGTDRMDLYIVRRRVLAWASPCTTNV